MGLFICIVLWILSCALFFAFGVQYQKDNKKKSKKVNKSKNRPKASKSELELKNMLSYDGNEQEEIGEY